MVQSTDKTSMETEHTNHFNTPFVEVTKTFNAPIEAVWRAWSNADLIKKWWGPKGYTCPSATLDFKEEGKFLFAMKDPEGKVTWGTGIYKEIFPHELIVCTDSFADENGKVISPKEAGMDGDWQDAGDTLLFSVKFTEITNTKTEIQLVHEGIPASMHDDCVNGWSSSLDKMKELVEKH